MVGDERAVEGDDRVPAARERPRVEAQPVVHRPRGEGNDGCERDARLPSSRDSSTRRRRGAGTRRRRGGRRSPAGTSASSATPRPTSAKRATEGWPAARDTSSAQSAKAGREHRLARELVEHQAVARVDEKRGRDERARLAARSVSAAALQATTEAAKRTAHSGSASAPPATSSESPATIGVTGVRKSIDHGSRTSWSKSWIVRVEVLVEVAAGLQRPGDRTNGVDREPEAEEDDSPEGSRNEPLEPSEKARERVPASVAMRSPREAS